MIETLLRWCGCEKYEIGRQGDLYLERWTILGKRFEGNWRVFLHRFHRSDGDVLHCHPWNFWSLILWPGYWERTPEGIRWHGPLSLLRRPAEWKHQVILDRGRKCWTLVCTGPKVRSWGFACPGGWIPWRQHAANEAATGDGCGVTEDT